jgi:hypothetical protein
LAGIHTHPIPLLPVYSKKWVSARSGIPEHGAVAFALNQHLRVETQLWLQREELQGVDEANPIYFNDVFLSILT